MKTSPKRITVSYVIPEELAKVVSEGAAREDTSKSRYVTKVLRASFADGQDSENANNSG